METTARILKALGDATRLRILALLSEGELCVCDIMAALSLPQSTASRHLAYLRNNGWVSGTRRGKWMYYRLTVESALADSYLGQRLLQYLVDLARAGEDRRALHEYLRTKDEDACTVAE